MKKITIKKHTATGNSMDLLAARLPTETVDAVMHLASTSSKRIAPTPPVHADDIAVDQLATAMKAKLAACRAKGKHGWDNPLECSIERLANLLAEAVVKGDPVDIANYAAMLYARTYAHKLIGESALRGLLHRARVHTAIDRRNAQRYLKLRNVPNDRLGAPGVPCISMPSGAKTGLHLNGDDADRAIDAVESASKEGA
ncbi:hypothetical protein [Cupriavidus sp.]|uniref:hypothetical protein n=1 Tax=Cupriavidus sp. TaxID=1873897 RepID=UPI003D0C00B4